MGENKSKEWRKKNRVITDEERSMLINHINSNMKKYDSDIKERMEHSDKVELQMKRVKTDIESEMIEL